MLRGFSRLSAYQIGDAMHKYPRLAGAGTGEHKYVCLFPMVSNDALLNRIVKTLHYCPPRFSRSLSRKFSLPIRQPAAKKILLFQFEVIKDQPHGLGHGPNSPAREFSHYMYLQNLSPVINGKRFKINFGETPFSLF